MSKKSTSAKKIKIKKVRLTSKKYGKQEILKTGREKNANFRFSKSNFTNDFLKTENVRIFSSIFLLQKLKFHFFFLFFSKSNFRNFYFFSHAVESFDILITSNVSVAVVNCLLSHKRNSWGGSEMHRRCHQFPLSQNTL